MTAPRLVLVLLLALIFRACFFTGLRGSDDLRYLDLALHRPLLATPVSVGGCGDFGALRPAFTAGVGTGLRVCGLSFWTPMLYPAVCSIGLVALLAWSAFRLAGPEAGWGAGLFAATCPGLVLSASSLYPDGPMVFWATLGILLLWAASSRGAWTAAGGGAALALGVFHKETALLLLPAAAWIAWRRLTPARTAAAAAAFLALLAFGWGAYLPRLVVGYLSETGRLQAQGDMSATLEGSGLGPRPWGGFLGMLVNPLDAGGFWMWGGVGLLALGALRFAVGGNPFLKSCAVWGLLALLTLNFAGIPGPGYFPMHPVAPRYLLLCIPPLVLLAGAFLGRFWILIPGGFRALAAGAGLLAAVVINLRAAEPNRAYGRVLRMAAEALALEDAPAVWSDRRTLEGLRLMEAGPHRLAEFPAEPPSEGLVVVNGPMLAFLERYGPAAPAWVANPPAGWRCLASSQVAGLRSSRSPACMASVWAVGAPAGHRAGGDTRAVTGRQRIVAALMGLGLIVFTFELVRRRRLREEYSWLWMLSAGVILFFALCNPALLWVTDLIGAGLPTSTLFLFGLFFLILISIHYAVKISTLTLQLKNLHQELAMLKERLGKDGRRPGDPAP